MSRGSTLFAFLAGAVTGAALLILANTEKGEEIFENGRAAVLKGLDKLEDALSARQAREESAPAAEETEA